MVKKNKSIKKIITTKRFSYDRQCIEYELVQSPSAKHIGVCVGIGGKVTVTKPKRMNVETVNKFIKEKKPWIAEKVRSFVVNCGSNKNLLVDDREHFLKHKERALAFCEQKVSYWNRKNKFKFNSIKVKQSRAQWGSCSSNKNLNFNYKILFLPEKMADSIIVHELCHLKELNHSNRFWSLVEKTLCDKYKSSTTLY